MLSPFALLSVFVLLSGIVTWVTYARRRTRFLPDFARLLERPEVVERFSDFVAARSLLKGEFRGRNVVILVQHRDEEPTTLTLAMETQAARTMDTYDFAGFKADREGESALFALEVKHELMLRHKDGYLEAEWHPLSLGLFHVFGPLKWQSVLVAMDALAGSVERRASAPPVADAR